MTAPVLMVVDEDANGLRALEDTVRSRYGHDYLIIGESSPAAALSQLGELGAAGEPVAVVMTGAAMAATAAAEFLAGLAPSSRKPSGCSWCRAATRPHLTCAFRCRWWLTRRRPRPSSAR